MKKTLLSLAALSALTIISTSAQAIPALSWTVNELAVDSVLTGPAPSVAGWAAFAQKPTTFVVNNMSLTYDATLTQGAFNAQGQASFVETGRFLIGDYFSGYETGVTNGSTVSSALGAGIYDLWGTFTISGVAQLAGNQLFVSVNSGAMDAYIDITPGGALASMTMDTRVGGATSVSSGGAVLTNTGNNDAANGSFEVIWSNFSRSPFGEDYWPLPTTFHMNLDINSDVDGIVGAFNPLGTVASTSGQGNAFFAVPEPTSISLIGLALLGMGFVGRKRKNM